MGAFDTWWPFIDKIVCLFSFCCCCGCCCWNFMSDKYISDKIGNNRSVWQFRPRNQQHKKKISFSSTQLLLNLGNASKMSSLSYNMTTVIHTILLDYYFYFMSKWTRTHIHTVIIGHLKTQNYNWSINYIKKWKKKKRDIDFIIKGVLIASYKFIFSFSLEFLCFCFWNILKRDVIWL